MSIYTENVNYFVNDGSSSFNPPPPLPPPPPPPDSPVLSLSSRSTIQPPLESSVPPRLCAIAVNSPPLKKRSREGGGFFGSPQHFVPLRFGSPPLYFSSAGAQFLPPQSPVIKPVQNRSLTFKYFLGSVLVFHSSALGIFLYTTKFTDHLCQSEESDFFLCVCFFC